MHAEEVTTQGQAEKSPHAAPRWFSPRRLLLLLSYSMLLVVSPISNQSQYKKKL